VVYLHKLEGSIDITFVIVDSVNWSTIEAGICIFCTCVPALRPITSKVIPFFIMSGRRTASFFSTSGAYSGKKSINGVAQGFDINLSGRHSNFSAQWTHAQHGFELASRPDLACRIGVYDGAPTGSGTRRLGYMAQVTTGDSRLKSVDKMEHRVNRANAGNTEGKTPTSFKHSSWVAADFETSSEDGLVDAITRESMLHAKAEEEEEIRIKKDAKLSHGAREEIDESGNLKECPKISGEENSDGVARDVIHAGTRPW
jgi:hypothetical protein